MIFYATKETMRKYELKTPDKLNPSISGYAQLIVQKEAGNRLYEWGCKILYFDGRMSLQFMHFETKLVIFMVDMKADEVQDIGDVLVYFLQNMYASDEVMQKALQRYFESSPHVVFDKMTDRSMIACMNWVQSDWAYDGYRFYDYISDGILHNKQINKDVNQMPARINNNGQEDYIIPYDYFEETIKKRFGVGGKMYKPMPKNEILPS